jgi:transcriptional regulator with XRE-family HTH domain
VGRRVAALRERERLSVPGLAKKARMDRTYVWRIERGDALPPVPRLAKLAAALNVTLSELLGGEAAADHGEGR